MLEIFCYIIRNTNMHCTFFLVIDDLINGLMHQIKVEQLWRRKKVFTVRFSNKMTWLMA